MPPESTTPALNATEIKEQLYHDVMAKALADNTRVAYNKGWSCFSDYCTVRGIPPLSATPEDIADFMIELAMQPRPASGKLLSMGTICLYRSAISNKYKEVGKTSPTRDPKVDAVLKGLARIRGTDCRQVKALREHQIHDMLSLCDRNARDPRKKLISLRDAAIIAIGFAAALRRSEICHLRVEDIEMIEPLPGEEDPSIIIHIRKSKTDQEGVGQRVAVPSGKYLKPVKRLKKWLLASGITNGYLFQTMKRGGSLRGRPMHHSDIPRLIKYYAKLAGLDESEIAGPFAQGWFCYECGGSSCTVG